MIDPKVIEYIKGEMAKGLSRDLITNNLIQGGGWSVSDINEHFLAIDSGKDVVLSDNNGVAVNKDSEGKKPKNINRILYVNLFGYFIYTILLVSFTKFFTGGNDRFLALFLYMGIYFMHTMVLFLLSIGEGMRGRLNKTKTGAFLYFLTSILIGIIGFGVCSTVFINGM